MNEKRERLRAKVPKTSAARVPHQWKVFNVKQEMFGLQCQQLHTAIIKTIRMISMKRRSNTKLKTAQIQLEATSELRAEHTDF